MIIVTILGFDAIVRAIDFRWCSLVSGACNVFEFGKGLLDVALHSANEYAFIVIPIEMDPDILFGGKIDFEDIFLIHDADKVLYVAVVGVFDAKIVDYQCEGNVTSDMFEESIGDASANVTMLFEMVDKVLMGDETTLF